MVCGLSQTETGRAGNAQMVGAVPGVENLLRRAKAMGNARGIPVLNQRGTTCSLGGDHCCAGASWSRFRTTILS